jgi:hypothetical protein
VECFPKTDHQIGNAKTGHRPAKPREATVV